MSEELDILGNKKEDDYEDEGMLVCVRAEKGFPVIYGSIRAKCRKCSHPVWVSISGQKAVKKDSKLKPWCIECGTAKMLESDEKIKAEIVPGALEELKRHFSKVREN